MRILWPLIEISPRTIYNFHLGVGSMAACAAQAGHESRVVHYGLGSDEENGARVLRAAREFRADVFAFSITANHWERARTLARFLKRETGLPTLFGGYHVTLDTAAVAADEGVDYAFRGEGEHTLIEALARLARGASLAGIPGCCARDFFDAALPKIHDLDRLPFQEVALFEFPKTVEIGTALYPTAAGRGCYYECTYCSTVALNEMDPQGPKVRTRSPAVVVEECARVKHRYPGIIGVEFWDEIFTRSLKWVQEFAPLYRREVGLPFHIMTRPEILNDEMLGTLKEAGCETVKIGVESGNETLRRKLLKRSMNNDRYLETFQRARHHGIKTWSFAMIGLPHETPELFAETLELHRRLRPHYTMLTVFYPFKGTALRDETLAMGWLPVEESPPVYFPLGSSVLEMPHYPRAAIDRDARRFREEMDRIGIEESACGTQDLRALLPRAEVVSPWHEGGRLLRLPEDVQGYWIGAHPPTTVRFLLDPGTATHLRVSYRMFGSTYDQEGEGVRFRVRVGETVLHDHYTDPKRRPADRGVFARDLLLPRRTRRPCAVVLETSGGPQGDLRFAGAAWGPCFLFGPADAAGEASGGRLQASGSEARRSGPKPEARSPAPPAPAPRARRARRARRGGAGRGRA